MAKTKSQTENGSSEIPFSFIRTAYDGLQSRLSDLTALDQTNPETGEPFPSLTKQAEADACDINKIMARYEKTHMIDHFNKYQGDYADLGTSTSYHESLNAVLAAQAAFDTLPAEIRARFDNEPAKFLDFVDDPKNEDAMREMGLLEALPDPELVASIEHAAKQAPPTTSDKQDLPVKS